MTSSRVVEGDDGREMASLARKLAVYLQLSAAQVDGWHSNEVPRETRARWLAGARQKGKWPLKWHFCALSSSSRGDDGRKVVALLASKSASALPGTLYGQQYDTSARMHAAAAL